MMRTVNPATEEVLAEYEEHSRVQSIEKLDAAWKFWKYDWAASDLQFRADIAANCATTLEKRREELAQLITAEMGKPIVAARGEIDKCAWLCRHYGESGAQYLEPVSYVTEARTYVRFDSVGPVLAIMPWNFPFWQALRFAVPNLVAGNVCLLKHAGNTTGCALAIEDVMREAGVPDGGFAPLLLNHERTAELMSDERVRGVTFTGSDVAGRQVAATAGRNLKKAVLELGGSDPFVVLEDADVDAAAGAAAASRFLNSGQSCINAKRLIVHDSIYEQFVERLVEEVDKFVVGDPMDDGTQIGPLARSDLRDEVHDQVHRTIASGGEASIVRGGNAYGGTGYYYRPTVIRDVGSEEAAAIEEVFGPVATVMRAKSESDAVRLANASRFGLGAAVWTSDAQRGESLAGSVEAGMVFVNESVKSDPRVPFGGFKDSGYGRELADIGMREFTNMKTVWNASS